jgi:tryptophan synthase alpha chain
MTVDAASGFVYATAVMGVTGARDQTSSLGEELVARVKKVTDKPVGVGLGVSNGAQAHEIAAYADAVIVGSALVRCLLDAPDESAGIDAIRTLARDLRSGVERN